MRIAAFSDIHSNPDALKKILSAAEKENADITVFCGDAIAKGDYPKECIEMLMKSGAVCLAGNCDLYYTRGVDIDPSVVQYRRQFASLDNILSPDEQNFVKNLPLDYTVEHGGFKIWFSHFIIKDRNAGYPYYPISSLDDGTFEAAAAELPYDLAVIGHSHREFVCGNVVSLCSSGLDYPNYLIIDVNEKIDYRIVKL